MNIVRNYALLIMLVMAPLAMSQAAGLYKWTDEEGNVHYTQTPPPQGDVEIISKEPPPPAQSEDKQTDETKAPEGASSVHAQNIKIKQQNCAAARKNLDIYQSADMVLRPDGSELELSDEMRAAKIKETQEQIKLYCE